MTEPKTDRKEPNYVTGFFYCYTRALAIMKLTQEQLSILQFKEKQVTETRKICDYYYAPFQIMKWFKLEYDSPLNNAEFEKILDFLYQMKSNLHNKFSFMEYDAGNKSWSPRYFSWEVRHLIDNEVFDNKDFKYKSKHREGNLDDII